MTSKEILSLTAVQLGEKIKSGEVTSVEAVKAALGQIKAMEPVLNSYVTQKSFLILFLPIQPLQ